MPARFAGAGAEEGLPPPPPPLPALALALLLAPLAIGWQAGLGYPYFAAAALLGGRFVQLALALQRTPTEPAAWAVFGYSNAYLFLLFGAIIADIGWVG